MPLLEVDNLKCSVRTGSTVGFVSAKKQVLGGVSLAIEEGTTVALLGESGSGKTTLARCIVGLLRPDSGTISFHGLNLFPTIENRESVGIEIQMMFQGGGASLDPTMTVLDSLAEGIRARLEPRSKVNLIGEAEQLISSVGMTKECLHRLPGELSGGQRQRIALARLLAVSPRLLILDEPTSALDALTSLHLLQLLKALQLKHGFSILYVTHDVRAALAFCDRIAVLHDGVIVEDQLSEDLQIHPKHDYTRQLLRDSRLMMT